MHTDVLFITPTDSDSILEESAGTLLLATILKDSGFGVRIQHHFDFGDPASFDLFLDNAIEEISKIRPAIVSFYTRCDSFHISIKLAERIKSALPKVYIVFAGPQADISAIDTIKEIECVDFVCCGEGENTVVPFFTSLINKDPDLTTAGLAYRVNGQAKINPRPELLQDLNNLPMVDYSIVGSFTDKTRYSGVKFPIDVGRGCPFGCTYCSTKTFWGRKYRLKSPDRIIAEIKDIHDRFGVTSFMFSHDMFTMNKRQVLETCQALKKLDFPVTWKCSARLDCIDKEMIDIMADCGMNHIYFGVETGSPRMQKLINKNLKLDSVIPMVEYIRDKNIQMTASFIYGFPEETEEDVSQTLAMIAKLIDVGGVKVQAHLCTFLPGTELSVRYIDQMSPTEILSDITGTVAVAECRDLIAAHPKLFQHFMEYKTPLRHKLRYFSTFVNIWQQLAPVYRYIAGKYDADQIIDMYYDYVKANADLLEATNDDAPMEKFGKLIQHDQFLDSYSDDECYQRMKDYCRFVLMKMVTKKGETRKDVFCFKPSNVDNDMLLQEIPLETTFVTYSKTMDGRTKMAQASFAKP